jgi:glucose/mannose-6-phosphate isomerase
MFDLNDVEAIHAADPHAWLRHIANLPRHLEAAWSAADALELPDGFQSIDRIVIAGVGDSATGGSLFASLSAPECRLPIVVARDYELPAWADGSNTLVVASSHSGDTEETLNAFEQARRRGCQLMVIAAGGELVRRSQALNLPAFIVNHPARPRAALGGSLAPLLNVASRLKWTHDFKDDLTEAVTVLDQWATELSAESPVAHNLAKREAGQLMGRIVFVLGAGCLAEAARRWSSELNQTANAWAVWAAIPEADHNLLQGLDWPADFTDKVMALFLTGAADHPRNAKRLAATRQALTMAGCNTDVIRARGESHLAQLLSLVYVGDFISFYLALSYGVEPRQIDKLIGFEEYLMRE